MTENFDNFVYSVIGEFTSAKSKRRNHKSRYNKFFSPPSSRMREVRGASGRSASQKTKVDKKQQYVGSSLTPRKKNKSEKSHDEAGIAKGLGGRLRRKGVNPRKPGSKVNSKQGRMEVKFVRDDGTMKVGSTGKTDYKTTKPVFAKKRK
jgi:hypothetical protein